MIPMFMIAELKTYDDRCPKGEGCVCAEEGQDCFSLGMSYCDCSGFDCPATRCCCPYTSDSAVCDADSPCLCKQDNCPELGMNYCSPDKCGSKCQPQQCCCADIVSKWEEDNICVNKGECVWEKKKPKKICFGWCSCFIIFYMYYAYYTTQQA